MGRESSLAIAATAGEAAAVSMWIVVTPATLSAAVILAASVLVSCYQPPTTAIAIAAAICV